MISELGSYLIIYVTSMFKFIAGPVIAAAQGFNFYETVIPTILGMMTTVIFIAFLGPRLRKWWYSLFGKSKRKVFTRRNRRFVYLWRKYGEFGISFLTPVVFSPIIGTLVVVTLGGKKRKIISFMLFSASFWACALFFLGETFLKVFSPLF